MNYRMLILPIKVLLQIRIDILHINYFIINIFLLFLQQIFMFKHQNHVNYLSLYIFQIKHNMHLLFDMLYWDVLIMRL